MKIENDRPVAIGELNYETIDMPSPNEGTRFLKTLRERGIFAATFDDVESRMKLVELGLSMPKEKDRWLLFDSNRCERALYIFFRLSVRNQMRSRLIVLRFDMAKYRSAPLSPDFDVGSACALFYRSIAVVAGLDAMKCELGHNSPGLN
jgi:hypothetical protein